jgi:hypothetical protein
MNLKDICSKSVALFALAVSLTNIAHAADKEKNLYLGVGTLFYNMSRVSTTETASKGLLGTVFIPTLGVTGDFWLISPNLSYTVLGKTDPDGPKTHILTLSVPFKYSLGPVFLKGGPGILFDMLSGPGGTAVLNNGTSTATFTLPSGSTTSRILFIDLGAGVPFYDIFRWDLDLFMTGALSSKRAVSILTQVSVGVF